jgi:hypothetical protein
VLRGRLHVVVTVVGAAVVAALLTVPNARTDVHASRAGRACTPVWRTVPSPQVAQGVLNGIAAISSREAWAVGGVVRVGGITGGEVVSGSPLIERWNGTRWSVTPTPKTSGVLEDVAATSRTNAWAVGFVPGSRAPFALHWDGRSWSRVKLPATVRATDAVAAVSARDVWVVGTSSAGYSDTGEVSHWDGRTWTRVVTRRDTQLADVAVVSRNDVWAVGSVSGDDFGRALMLHWDGSRWQTFSKGPTGGNDDSWLDTVGANSSRDVWAGGGEHEEEMSPPAIGPRMLHWDGARWSNVALPASGETEFADISTVSPSEAWAVSANYWSYEEQGTFGYGTWHRIGRRWHATELPYGAELYGIAVTPSGHRDTPVVWAVGQLGTRIVDYATRTVPLIRRFGC